MQGQKPQHLETVIKTKLSPFITYMVFKILIASTGIAREVKKKKKKRKRIKKINVLA